MEQNFSLFLGNLLTIEFLIDLSELVDYFFFRFKLFNELIVSKQWASNPKILKY